MQRAVVGQERVVLRLVREHRGVAPVELQLHVRRQQRRDLARPPGARRPREKSPGTEKYTPSVSASSSVTPRRGELATHQREHLASAPRDLVGGVHVGEAREPRRAEVAVGRVDHELHRRRQRLVRVALGRARRGAAWRAALAASRCSTSRSTMREERAQPIARRADAVLRASATDTGSPRRPSRCAAPRRSRTGAAPRRCAACRRRLVRGQRRARAQVGAHQQRIEHARGRARIGQALVAARRHARERERRAAEQARHARRPPHVVAGVAAHALGIAEVDLVDA